MKKYEYVNLEISKIFSSSSEEHREIIDKYAARGYRYIGYVPTHINCDGRITKMDLIFELDI